MEESLSKSRLTKKNLYKNNRILDIKTTQTSALKQVFERISNIISDCCIVFIPPNDVTQLEDEDFYEEVHETTVPKRSKYKRSNSSDDEDVDTKKSQHKKSTKKRKNKKSDSEEEVIESKSKSRRKRTNDESKSKTRRNKRSSSEEDEVKVKKTTSPKKNPGGIRIVRLTEDKNILVKLTLAADKFDYFICEEPKITIGVDMQNLFAYLKMVNDDDPLILYMNRDNRNILYIRSLSEKSEEKDIEINLMDISNPERPIRKTKFNNVVTMASDKFHSICKSLSTNSTFVEIVSSGGEISFRGQNEGGKATMTYKDPNYKPKDNVEQELVQGVYVLRNLLYFSKCNKLCTTIVIYLKNDFPLVLMISIATLGKMYVFLTPIDNPTN